MSPSPGKSFDKIDAGCNSGMLCLTAPPTKPKENTNVHEEVNATGLDSSAEGLDDIAEHNKSKDDSGSDSANSWN